MEVLASYVFRDTRAVCFTIHVASTTMKFNVAFLYRRIHLVSSVFLLLGMLLSLSLSSRIPFRLITPFNRAFIFQEKFALVIPRETRRKVFFLSPSFSSLCGFPFSNWRRKISRNRLDLQLTKIASGEIDVVTIIVMGKYWEKRCHRN